MHNYNEHIFGKRFLRVIKFIFCIFEKIQPVRLDKIDMKDVSCIDWFNI